MTRINSLETIRKLNVIFARFGLPSSITLDNGRQFTSDEFHQYCEVNNIELNYTIPYWPQQKVERQKPVTVEKIIDCTKRRNRLARRAAKVFADVPIQSTFNNKTVTSELMFNRKIRDKLPSFNRFIVGDDELRDRDWRMKRKVNNTWMKEEMQVPTKSKNVVRCSSSVRSNQTN